jgi:O-antigen/teichoic acid export membrane protein
LFTLLVWRKLFSDIGAVAGATIVLALVGAAATIALAHLLPVEQFGKVSILLLAFNLTSTFDAVRPVTIYFANRYVNQPQETFACIFWLNAGIGGTLAVALTGVAFATSIEILQRGEVMCLAGVFLLALLHSAYWGWADAHGLVAGTALIRSLTLIVVYVAFVLAATAVMLTSCWWLCHSRQLATGVSRPNSSIMKAIGAEVRRSMQFNIATLILATTDRLAIYSISGSRMLGIYSGHFDLATKPMALLRAVQSALNPHLTRAVADNKDIFPLVASATKVLFGALSVVVWIAVFFRESITRVLLGSDYVSHAEVFAAVVLAQCFVLLGYSSNLFLNSSGDFRVQKTYYSFAAVAMLLLVVPATYMVGLTGVAIVYLVVRTVDVGLLRAAVRTLGRDAITPKIVLTAVTWCGAGLSAWLQLPGACLAFSTLHLVMLWCFRLTRPSACDGSRLATSR